MSNDANANETPAPRPKMGLGRRIILGIWGVGIIWITIVAFASVIPQVFDPPRAEPTDEPCIDAHRRLFDELMTHTQENLGQALTDQRAARDRSFFRSWDAQYNALDRCDDDNHVRLGRLRYRIDNSMRRFGRDEGQLARALERALAGGSPERH